MSEKYESADLILKLYELRREEKMRRAREWFGLYLPESAAEIMRTVMDPETSAYFRMVTSYWDMAASFVNHGAIDPEMFAVASPECIAVFARLAPFLAELREITKRPKMFENLERYVMGLPDAAAMLAAQRELMRKWRDAQSE